MRRKQPPTLSAGQGNTADIFSQGLVEDRRGPDSDGRRADACKNRSLRLGKCKL